MRSSYKKILDSIRRYSPLLDFAEMGLSPAEVKQIIIDQLSLWFTNQDVLNRLAVELLAPEAVSLAKISGDPWAIEMFQKVLEDYRAAAALNKDACFSGCAHWEGKILHGVSEYWSAFYLEVDKASLAIDELKYEAFRNIGSFIEASIQPLLKELLLQIRIRRGSIDPEAGLETMDLGLAVGELYDTSGYPDLFAPPPWHIRLNQWRNMAQHHNTRVEGNMIIGVYGRGHSQQEVRLTREELILATRLIHQVLALIRTARSLFLIDNADEAQPYFTAIDSRADTNVFQLVAAIATQGFQLVDITIEDESVVATVQDLTKRLSKERMMHSTQFVYPVWCRCPKELVVVKTIDYKGDLLITTGATRTDCQSVAEGNIPFHELASKITIELSEKGRKCFAT